MIDGIDVCAQLDVGALLSDPSIVFGLLNLFDPLTPLNPFPRLAIDRAEEEHDDEGYGAKAAVLLMIKEAIAIERFIVIIYIFGQWIYGLLSCVV